jgi:hypothetical protein
MMRGWLNDGATSRLQVAWGCKLGCVCACADEELPPAAEFLGALPPPAELAALGMTHEYFNLWNLSAPFHATGDTVVLQGWPKTCANFRRLIRNLSSKPQANLQRLGQPCDVSSDVTVCQ